eukprot:tig00000455_g1053.t1
MHASSAGKVEAGGEASKVAPAAHRPPPSWHGQPLDNVRVVDESITTRLELRTARHELRKLRESAAAAPAATAAAGPGADDDEGGTLALIHARERLMRLQRRNTINLGDLRSLRPPKGVALIPQLQHFYKANEGGQIELFTPQALLRRESIRFEPRIVLWLHLYWRSIDLDGSNTLEEDEFVPYAMLLFKLLHKSKSGEFNEEKARRFAMEDWEEDRQGKNYINTETFMVSLFQVPPPARPPARPPLCSEYEAPKRRPLVQGCL